ncbi:MAG: M48 family metalloprotease [Acidobacteriota bacterium]|nr:MAG: M48 family metalloprotease [Acidobacteriota bacterium]
MRKIQKSRFAASAMLVWVLLLAPMAALAQTEIKMPKNKYKVEDDVKLGNEVSAKVENQFPILSDSASQNYLQDVGERLVLSIPREFRHPEFDYRFKIVNASDINAFALPGGPMYVNRGMIEAAKNEGEMAGVMAHEISHVALRHGTAQATKQSNPLNQILGIGAILGGAILGGQLGAQLGALFAQGYFLRYSRDYERQADILGARILADAGYDPRDLANMFRTINEQSEGGRPPEWLSSHPDPSRRYETINREAELLRVSPEPIKLTPGFLSTQQRLRRLPPARTLEEIQKDTQSSGGQGASGGMASGRYTRNVPYPSSAARTYATGNWLLVNVPSNWKQFEGESEVWFAPDGAYGNQGITHGALIGVNKTNQRNLANATQEYVNGILQANTYLRRTTGYSSTYVDGRSAYAVMLAGRSPVTGETEYALVYTTQLRSGDLFYVVGVAPRSQSSAYNRAFNEMVRSIELND